MSEKSQPNRRAPQITTPQAALHEVIVNNRLHLDLLLQKLCSLAAKFSSCHHGSFLKRIIALPLKQGRQERNACQLN
jgi:hypothetical protein